jgi:methyl-accepting chemotaxis protein
MTLKSKIILFLLLFTIIPSVIIGNVVYIVSSNTIENKVSDMNEDIGVQVTKNVNHALKEFENITLVPFSNMDLMEQLDNDEGLTEYELFNKQREIKEYFSSITFTNKNAKAILFVNDEKTVYGETNAAEEFDIENYLNSDIPEKVEDLSGSVLWALGPLSLWLMYSYFKRSLKMVRRVPVEISLLLMKMALSSLVTKKN